MVALAAPSIEVQANPGPENTTVSAGVGFWAKGLALTRFEVGAGSVFGLIPDPDLVFAYTAVTGTVCMRDVKYESFSAILSSRTVSAR